MPRHRHEDSNRVVWGVTPLATRLAAERLRQRATPRKLRLLECAIIRNAPFADCGRTIWELLPLQRWFATALLPAGWYRTQAATGRAPVTAPGTGQPWPLIPANGHLAIEWFEQSADTAADDDRLLLARAYFRHAEYAAEADRFNTPDDLRDVREVSYGVASWLLALQRDEGPKLCNVLDYYVATFPGEFYVWAGHRPFHPGHQTVATGLIYDIFGNPFRPVAFAPEWRTGTTVAIASQMYESRDFSEMPILADALQDAGCDNDDVLSHCRDAKATHVRGCWVVDQVLGNE